MKLSLLLGTALLAPVGCDDGPSKPKEPPVSTGYWVATQGIIMQVTAKDSQQGTYVVIETEDHQMLTVHLIDGVPPAWPGLHGQFAYESADKSAGTWKNFIVKRRLSPDYAIVGSK